MWVSVWVSVSVCSRDVKSKELQWLLVVWFDFPGLVCCRICESRRRVCGDDDHGCGEVGPDSVVCGVCYRSWEPAAPETQLSTVSPARTATSKSYCLGATARTTSMAPVSSAPTTTSTAPSTDVSWFFPTICANKTLEEEEEEEEWDWVDIGRKRGELCGHVDYISDPESKLLQDPLTVSAPKRAISIHGFLLVIRLLITMCMGVFIFGKFICDVMLSCLIN